MTKRFIFARFSKIHAKLFDFHTVSNDFKPVTKWTATQTITYMGVCVFEFLSVCCLCMSFWVSSCVSDWKVFSVCVCLSVWVWVCVNVSLGVIGWLFLSVSVCVSFYDSVCVCQKHLGPADDLRHGTCTQNRNLYRIEFLWLGYSVLVCVCAGLCVNVSVTSVSVAGCLTRCVSICLSVSVFVWIYLCFWIYLGVYLSVSLSSRVSLSEPMGLLANCVSLCLLVTLWLCLCVCVCLSVYGSSCL